MQIAKKRSFLINFKPKYIELQYIEKNNYGQYIDSGLKFKDKYQVQMKCQYPVSTSNDTWMLGTWQSSSSSSSAKDFLIGYYSGLRAQCGIDQSINYSTAIANDYNPHIFGIMRDRFIVDEINQTTYPDYNNLPTVYANRTIPIFKSYHVDNAISRRLYWCKFWDWNDTLVRDFIPVKDENEVVCLYDKVTKTYFYNQGSGDFIAGPEKDN